MPQPARSTIFICLLLAFSVLVESIPYKLPSYAADLPNTRIASLNYSTHDISELRFAPPSMARFREITDRPLFTPTRRRAVSIPPSPIEIFLLRGVVLSKRHNTALVERRSDGVLLRMREGDRFDGWQVKFIGEDTIEFGRSKKSYVIEMAGYTQDLSNDLGEDLASEGEHLTNDVGAGEKEFNPLLGIALNGGQASHRRLPTRSDAQTDEGRNLAYPTAVPGELPPPPPPPLPRVNRTRRS